MNGPNLYGIANPDISRGEFSTNFTDITPNVEFFDVQYLYNRSQQVLGQEIANLLSPIQIVRWNSFKKRIYPLQIFRYKIVNT